MTRRTVALFVALACLAGSCSTPTSTTIEVPPVGSTATTRTSAPRTADDKVEGAALRDTSAFADVPWAGDLDAELRTLDGLPRSTGPDGRYAVADFDGELVRVVDGERATLVSTCRCPRRVIWLIGSATAFGLGQRDDHTMASTLVRRAEADGIALEVRNFAAPGLTQAEERRAIVAHLEAGDPPPDLVVVVDGFNDVLASFMYAAVRGGDLLEPIRFDDAWVDEFIGTVPPPSVDDQQLGIVADHVVSSYRSGQRDLGAVLDASLIPVAWFFEPDPFVSARQAEGLASSLGLTADQVARESPVGRLAGLVAEGLGADVHDLRSPLAALDQAVYADTSRLNETGATFLADLVYPTIAPTLR